MRIEKLSLKNFRGFEELEIDFPEGEGGLAVFIGENGSGKTSVLKGIFYHQKSIYDILKSISRANSKQKKILAGSLPNSGNKLSKENINIYSNQLSLKSLWGIHEGKIEISNSLEKDEPQNYSSESYRIGGKPIKNEENEFPAISFYRTNRGVKSHPSLKALDLSKVEIEESFQLNDSQEINFDYFFEWFRNTEDFENEQRLYTNPNYRHFGLSALRNILQRFLKNYSNPRVKRQPIEKLVMEKGEGLLSVEQLSHGEKLVFAIIGDIIRRISITQPNLENPLDGKGVVLIDEIEQHLHPSWQRTIIPNLRKTFPNIQFIITTHSPQVLSNVPRENVFILADFKLVKRTPHTFGRDTNSILYDLFGVEKRPKESEKEISKLYKYIDANDRAKAEKQLEKIKENFGSGDVEVLRAESYIDLMDE